MNLHSHARYYVWLTTKAWSFLTLNEYEPEDELCMCSVRSICNLTALANPVYDAVWVLALALNISHTELNDNNITLTEESHNRQNKITEIIQRHMLDVDFQGITGQIRFESETGFVNTTVDLYQYNDSGVSKRMPSLNLENLQFYHLQIQILSTPTFHICVWTQSMTLLCFFFYNH